MLGFFRSSVENGGKGGGGDGGIRTLDTRYQVWFLSRELVSATYPRLRIAAALQILQVGEAKGAYNEGVSRRQVAWRHPRQKPLLARFATRFAAKWIRFAAGSLPGQAQRTHSDA